MTAVIPPSGGSRAPSDCNSAPAQIYDEYALETAIAAAHERLLDAEGWDARRAAWSEFADLVKQRTPSRVRFMERMRGLA